MERRFILDEECRTANRKSEFIRDAKPNDWRSLASELREAADLLWNDRSNGLRAEVDHVADVKDGQFVEKTIARKIYSISRPFILLAGFAIENLLKGLIVESRPETITSGTLHDSLKSHSLEQLAGQLEGIEFSSDELKFLRTAQSAIPYWGRYPIPLNFNRVVPEVGMTEQHYQTFSVLFDRLDRELFFRIRDGWELENEHRSLPVFDAKYDPPERLEEVIRLCNEWLSA